MRALTFVAVVCGVAALSGKRSGRNRTITRPRLCSRQTGTASGGQPGSHRVLPATGIRVESSEPAPR